MAGGTGKGVVGAMDNWRVLKYRLEFDGVLFVGLDRETQNAR